MISPFLVTTFTFLTYFTLFLCHFPQLPLATSSSSKMSLTHLPGLYQPVTLIYASHNQPLSTPLKSPSCSIFSTTHCPCNIPLFSKQLTVFELEGPWNSVTGIVSMSSLPRTSNLATTKGS